MHVRTLELGAGAASRRTAVGLRTRRKFRPASSAAGDNLEIKSGGVAARLHWPNLYSWKKNKRYGRENGALNSECFRLNIGKNDLVTFYDGDDLTAKVLGQYGGAKARFKLYTSTADVTIQFQSDPATNVYGYGNGFVVHFFGKIPKTWSVLGAGPALAFIKSLLS